MSSDESSPQPSGFPAQILVEDVISGCINCVAIACLAFSLRRIVRPRILPCGSVVVCVFRHLVCGDRSVSQFCMGLASYVNGGAVASIHCRASNLLVSEPLQENALRLNFRHSPSFVSPINTELFRRPTSSLTPMESHSIVGESFCSPYLDNSPLAHRFHWDEPWDGSNNGPISATAVFEYHCPSDAMRPTTSTNYVAVIGPNTAWPNARRRSNLRVQGPLSKTILLVEVADSGINWAEPRDLSVAQAIAGVNGKKGLGISSHHAGGAWRCYLPTATWSSSRLISLLRSWRQC